MASSSYTATKNIISLIALVARFGLFFLDALVPRRGVTKEKNLAYGGKNKLDLYLPRYAGKKNPIIIFIHGGNWSTGSKNEYGFLGKSLAHLGLLTVIPGYRTFPSVRYPTFIEDAAQAVRWTHENIAKHGGDPEKIFVMGHSAGGHMAALIAMDDSYGTRPYIKGMIGLAGAYDFFPLKKEFFKRIFGDHHADLKTQPITFASANNPPLLLLHGTKDDTVGCGNSKRLAAKVTEKGGKARYVAYEGCNHWRILLGVGFGPLRKPMTGEILKFIELNGN